MAKTLVGIVTSDKTDKTIVVTVTTRKTHPLYRKQYSNTSKFMAHDEKNEAKTGDKVLLTETRPLSARKRHVLSKVLERPVLREGIVGDVEVPLTEKKPIVKKAKEDKPVVEELDGKTPTKKAVKKPSKKEESEGDKA